MTGAASLWSTILVVLLKIASILGIVLLLFSVLIMLLTYRKAKKISPLSLIFSMLISLTSLIIYMELLKVRLPILLWMAAFAAGGLMGIGWSLTSRLVWIKGLIKSQGDIWYLVVWALVFVVNQLIVLFTGRPVQVAMIMLLTGTGLVMGNSSSTLIRFYHLRSRGNG
jgi:hypothetical protein